MRLRLDTFSAAATALILSTLAACSAQDSPASASGGSSAGGSVGASTSGGSAGSASGGLTASGGKSAGGANSSTFGGTNATGGNSNGGNANSGANTSSGGSGGANNAGAAGAKTNGGSTSGGSSSGGSSNSIPATFETVRLVFQGGGPITPCASAPCHGLGGMAPPGHPLILQDNGDLYTNVTTYTSKACGNIPLVNKGNPNESALIKILKGPCGNTPRMPYGCKAEDGSCIPDDYIAAISQWIANGAPKN